MNNLYIGWGFDITEWTNKGLKRFDFLALYLWRTPEEDTLKLYVFGLGIVLFIKYQ